LPKSAAKVTVANGPTHRGSDESQAFSDQVQSCSNVWGPAHSALHSNQDIGVVINHNGYEIVEMISAKSIAAMVKSLAKEITEHFADTDKLIVIGLLRGSFVFVADLVRELDLPVEVDFLEVSSYGDSMESSREVRIIKDLRSEIEGLDVLVVEDIIDTGHTLHHVINLLRSRGPKRLEVATLLDKPSRREVEVNALWVGFEIPDEFVVGYGIDYAQRNRNLPYVGKVQLKG
jgi:hypoxanthine phosphoribosyltransferase